MWVSNKVIAWLQFLKTVFETKLCWRDAGTARGVDGWFGKLPGVG